MRRASTEQQRDILKVVSRRAVKAAGGGAMLSDVSRVSEGQISKYCSTSPDCEDVFLPIDVALEADLEAGSPIIVSAMAGMLGFRLVRADEADAARPALPDHKDIMTLDAVFSQLKSVMAEAIDDGRVDEGERRLIGGKGDQLMRDLRQIMARAGVAV